MKKTSASRKKGHPEPSTSEAKLPKLPKISMPEDFKIRTRPLFSLPEEVLKLPPPTSKAAKIQAAKAGTGGGHRKRSSGIDFNSFLLKLNKVFILKIFTMNK